NLKSSRNSRFPYSEAAAAQSTAFRSNAAIPAPVVFLIIVKESTMSTIERLHAPISDLSRPRISTVVPDDEKDAIALRQRVVGSSFFWPIQLLPAQRREAMYALYAFCRELHDIADGEAS